MSLPPPDWAAFEALDEFELIGAFEADGGDCYVMPQSLRLDRDQDGRPSLDLELVRGALPDAGPEPYGVLSCSTALSYPLGAALEAARARLRGATVSRAPIDAAWLALRALELPDGGEPLATSELRSVGFDAALSVIRLDADQAALIRRSIEQGAVAIEARVEVEIEGIAPRFPLRLDGSPRAIATWLHGRPEVGPDATISRAALRRQLTESFDTLPVEIRGPVDDFSPTQLVERLLDWVRTEFARFAPSRSEDGPSLALRAIEEFAEAAAEWDLSRPWPAGRSFEFRFDPLGEAYQWGRDRDGGDFVHLTEIPPFSPGPVVVELAAALPGRRRGLLECGATVSVPANPPFRVESLRKTVPFVEPSDRDLVELRFAPDEPLEYACTAYAVFAAEHGIERLFGPERPALTRHLTLNVADFPIRFLTVAGSPGLLALADLRVSVLGAPIAPVELTATTPSVAIGLAPLWAEPALAVEASELGGERVAAAQSGPAGLIDLHSFRAYGPQRLAVEWHGGGSSASAFELVAEGEESDPGAIGLVHFGPGEETRLWSWFSDSPFGGGYRWRPLAAPGEPAMAWSERRDPAEPLVLVATPSEVAS